MAKHALHEQQRQALCVHSRPTPGGPTCIAFHLCPVEAMRHCTAQVMCIRRTFVTSRESHAASFSTKRFRNLTDLEPAICSSRAQFMVRQALNFAQRRQQLAARARFAVLAAD